MTVRFIKVYDPAPDIESASADAKDHAPLRGRKFCAPLNVASSIGWYVYPPLNFHLNWDGRNFFIMFDDSEDWMLVDQITFPNYAEKFEAIAEARGIHGVPPFLDVFPELGVIQVWTGYMLVTDPQDSIWVRAPINMPGSLEYDVFDGVIDTDWWRGPIIVNLRFHKTDAPVSFKRHRPIGQVFSLPRAFFDQSRNQPFEQHNGLEALTDEDWNLWRVGVDRLLSSKVGSYIHEAKKHRG
ncbi:DUF6065 family protein [Mesorhizobium sp. BE184]|uniref:DUF6065 family protein n=1 Tax=Mesorhizobium sp. BE184 TaxID=2817714 RepID=UPI002855D850|nr:DUF6065 family protein [Mesorhizobium sp. BE184]MDR7033999.1 hypothetical protein [Mesorhizobium sp. BE184]